MRSELVPEIRAYIDLVYSGTIQVCKEQLQLCAYVEACFQTEPIFVDTGQLANYLSLQKYFPYRLFEWELFCFTLHCCTYTADGFPRWPNLFIMVGRGAGKNGYLSFEDFCLLSEYNGIQNYDIDICANAEDQARTSFDDVWNVLDQNERKLKQHFRWNKEVIECIKTKSRLRFRTSNAKTKDGGRPGKVDFDEKHAYENYQCIQVFRTGLGKKRHPRTTTITTNGDVRGGPLDDDLAQAEQILNEGRDDNGTLPFICRLDGDGEVSDPAMWEKANPSLRYLPELRRLMLQEFEAYKANPVANSSFMVKRMNRIQGNRDTEVTSWENILAANRPLPDVRGRSCAAGIDYAKTTDFVTAGMLFLFEGNYIWLSHTWVCESCADLPRIKPPLREWEAKGLLTFVDAVEIAPEIPAGWLAEQARLYNITVLNLDKFRHTLLARALSEAGFDTEKSGANNIRLIRPSDQSMIAPTIASAFANKKVIWGDNPLMNWFTNNTCIFTSKSGNMVYGKIEPKSRKTDGFMAFMAAMCAAADLEEQTGGFDFGVYTY